MTTRFISGDAARAMMQMPSGSAHMGLTSPPYDRMRTYGGQVWDFEAVAAELYRVLCDGGVLCWVVGDQTEGGSESLTSMRQAIHFVDRVGFRMHDTMIYQKANFSNPERVRYHQVFEYVLVLSKGAPRTFNPIRDKRNAAAGKPGTVGRNGGRREDGSRSARPTRTVAEFGMRGNVWRGLTRGQEEMGKSLPHPAMMPRWLARDLIISWSNPGDLVIDPMAGSGTTGEQAAKLGRDAIMIDSDPACAGIQKDRPGRTPEAEAAEVGDGGR